MDLPSSDDDDAEYEKSARANGEEAVVITSLAADSKKIADKERKAMEKAFQMKQEALREDDNVFDVAFEGQVGFSLLISSLLMQPILSCSYHMCFLFDKGDDNVVTSATDVKVTGRRFDALQYAPTVPESRLRRLLMSAGP